MSSATLDISEARSTLSTMVDRLRENNVIWITRHNKKAFAIVNHELMEALLETLEILRDPAALQLLQESLNDIRSGQLVDHEDLKQEIQSWHGDSQRRRSMRTIATTCTP